MHTKQKVGVFVYYMVAGVVSGARSLKEMDSSGKTSGSLSLNFHRCPLVSTLYVMGSAGIAWATTGRGPKRAPHLVLQTHFRSRLSVDV